MNEESPAFRRESAKCPDERPEPGAAPDWPLTIADVDGSLRLLAAMVPHLSPREVDGVLRRVSALQALRASLVAAEVAELDRAWRLTWPGDGPPEWSGQASGEGVS